MPQGTPKPGPRHTEDVARETVTGLFLQALDAMRTNTPEGWATASKAFDEAADACRITERELIRRREVADRQPRAMEVHVVEIRTFDLNELIEAMFCQPLGRAR